MLIRDRIRELRRVPASQLSPNPRNWRRHPAAQENALRGMLAEIGWAGAVLARERADGVLELIDGHLRADTASSAMIPVLVLDVTEEEAAKILATHDPIGAMAEADPAMLEQLLAEIETESDGVRALLDELAEKAQAKDLEPIEPGDGESASGAHIAYLTLGDWKIPIDEEEFAEFDAAIKAYSDTNGTTFGFCRHVLEKLHAG